MWQDAGSFSHSICYIDVNEAQPKMVRMSSVNTSGGHRDGRIENAQFCNPSQIYCDADYPNTYTLEKTSYSTYHNFLLHYRYKNSEGELWSDDESLVRVSLAGVVSSLGNEDVTGQIELASSGSLTKFAYTTSTSITLPKGRSKLKFYMDKASYNLLEMKFTYKQP